MGNIITVGLNGYFSYMTISIVAICITAVIFLAVYKGSKLPEAPPVVYTEKKWYPTKITILSSDCLVDLGLGSCAENITYDGIATYSELNISPDILKTKSIKFTSTKNFHKLGLSTLEARYQLTEDKQFVYSVEAVGQDIRIKSF
jgi:hypothetical protein